MTLAMVRRDVAVGRGRGDRPDRRIRIAVALWAAFVGIVGAWRPSRGQEADPPRPEPDRLFRVVETLASPEFAGRRGAGADKAADYLVDRFRKLGLKGAFAGGYTQDIPGQEPGSRIGRNVAAMLRGDDPKLRDEWIILAAHFDHLGVRNGTLYPGADDNASAVAMMLESARCIVEATPKPKRSIMFIGFDLEETGLYGSRYFVAHPPVPLDRIALFVTADMIGRSLGGFCGDHVFVMGTEHAPGLRPWIERAGRGRKLTVDLLGSDLLVLNRSDYGPFRTRSIPFLFFTTGESPAYHSPRDVPETLDRPKMTEIARMMYQVVRSALDAPAVPRWQDQPDHPFAEAVALHKVIKLISQHEKALNVGVAQSFVIKNTLSLLDDIVSRGTITPDERDRVIQGTRIILFTVL